ncbi:DUF1837 domain-containing protein [Planctomycetes bacterium TBK1r]|uniref:Anti-bacteriophage protein A/HamA C-terminal domain-containing protein n=1 Tax=Stieleria magnilauensis TaxID=2527963 RepID=A0ABX5Y6A5_9BACT|nr:hypothetical protein TBK1r_75810 [Planctomycetes bacterium TBK1r]
MTSADTAPALTEEAFLDIVRGNVEDLDAYHGQLVEDTVDGLLTVRTRYLLSDAMDRPRVKDLAAMLVYSIIDYAFPRSVIAAAKATDADTGMTRETAKLFRKARDLFVKLDKTGEGGELLLFLLTESLLRIPQVLCKMRLKTSGGVHYHGCDGLHMTVDPTTSNLCVYWGEAKMYADYSSAISSCLDSLKGFLLGDGGSGSVQERDIDLLSDHLDLDDEVLESALVDYLDPSHPKFRQLEYRGACFVGFDADAYPSGAKERTSEEVRALLATQAPQWTKSVQRCATSRELSPFVIDLFCLPFPSVASFRNAFLHELMHQ